MLSTASGARPTTTGVWETASPRLSPASVPAGDGPVLAVGFTPENRELRVATPHLSQRGYPLDPERAAALACARARGGTTQAEWRTYLPGVEYRRTC
ncbi:hypothetical protein ACQEVY_08320 [Streptomyces sp. CA-288835]|uniref:hypothetical protein n=1 Tax=Streptomyces sp. CA-288835 TaxID=3240069 RepID=UPI003D93CDF2